jgi:sec-independent protein translocase protein TatA
MFISDILQPTHLLLILVVALLVLGPQRLPDAARSIGRGVHDFRRAVTGETDPALPDAEPGGPVREPRG